MGLADLVTTKIILEQDHFYSELALDLVFFTKDRPSNLG